MPGTVSEIPGLNPYTDRVLETGVAGVHAVRPQAVRDICAAVAVAAGLHWLA